MYESENRANSGGVAQGSAPAFELSSELPMTELCGSLWSHREEYVSCHLLLKSVLIM